MSAGGSPRHSSRYTIGMMMMRDCYGSCLGRRTSSAVAPSSSSSSSRLVRSLTRSTSSRSAPLACVCYVCRTNASRFNETTENLERRDGPSDVRQESRRSCVCERESARAYVRGETRSIRATDGRPTFLGRPHRSETAAAAGRTSTNRRCHCAADDCELPVERTPT